MFRKLLYFLLATVAGAASQPALAQDYPAKGPIKMVVGFAPGGGADAIARSLNVPLSEKLKQHVIVDNRPGAGSSLAAGMVAKSPGDGYTIIFETNSHAINQALYPKLPFDTERDFKAVTLVGSLPQVLAANPAAPANTLKEFLQQAKTGNSRARYAHGGVGSPGHFAGANLESMAGVELEHVAYKGAGPAITDVIGGHVPYIISTLAGLLPHIKAGKLKAIAITSPVRSPLLPNVPTIAESGFPGYDMDTWLGIFVPSSTPDSIVKTLHEATMEALKNPEVRARIEAQGGRIIGGDGAELAALVKKDIATYTKLVKERGIKAE